jgi:hypothetical protein
MLCRAVCWLIVGVIEVGSGDLEVGVGGGHRLLPSDAKTT